MPDAFELFSLFILFLIGLWAWRYLRAGSLVGAMLGGRIRETVGETVLHASRAGTTVLRVQLLEPRNGGEPFVGVSLTSKSPLGAGMAPFRLTREQARDVGELLRQASGSFCLDAWRPGKLRQDRRHERR